MDELIYSFLLQLDYPRASIVFDVDLLSPSPQIGSGMKVPTFVVVDPDTVDPLAVIEVVDSADTDSLADIGTQTGAYASRLGGTLIQGFVIRVNLQAKEQQEQVEFYRIWPNSTLKQLSGKNFPDFGALRVGRKLAVWKAAKAVDEARSDVMEVADAHVLSHVKTDTENSAGAGLYLPAVVLLLLIIADVSFKFLQGQPLLTLQHCVLAVAVASLLTLPAAIRYLRR